MALKIAHDLRIFRTLSDTASFVTCEQLAAVENADEFLVGKVPRTLYIYSSLQGAHDLCHRTSNACFGLQRVCQRAGTC